MQPPDALRRLVLCASSAHSQAAGRCCLLESAASDMFYLLVTLACVCPGLSRKHILSGEGRRGEGLRAWRLQTCALESLQLYAPMGHAVGLGRVSAAMEDACFQVFALAVPRLPGNPMLLCILDRPTSGYSRRGDVAAHVCAGVELRTAERRRDEGEGKDPGRKGGGWSGHSCLTCVPTLSELSWRYPGADIVVLLHRAGAFPRIIRRNGGLAACDSDWQPGYAAAVQDTAAGGPGCESGAAAPVLPGGGVSAHRHLCQD